MQNLDVRYFVDEEKKIVVCKIECCCHELIIDMARKGWPGDEALLLNHCYTGKAKCSSEDTFDVELGKKIAFKRAIAKLNVAKKRTLTRFISEFAKVQAKLEKDAKALADKYETTATRQEESIAHMLKEV